MTAPNVEWYDPAFIEEHPTWLFVYADMAPDGKDNDCDTKCDEGLIAVGDLLITEIMRNPDRVRGQDYLNSRSYD